MSAFDPGLVRNELLSALLVLVGLGVAAWSSSAAPPDRAAAGCWSGGAVLALVGTVPGRPHPRLRPLAPAGRGRRPPPAAGATWLGGLVGLVVSLRALAGREVLAATTLARFSTLAGGLLLAVAATGTFLAWRIVGSWSGLVETRYGWLLLAKVAIALLVAALGGWNRWRTLPAVERAAGFGDREAAAAAVTRTVRVEAVLLVALLGVTGFLVNQSPVRRRSRPSPAPPGSVSPRPGPPRPGGDGSPATGSNTLLVQVQDAAGEPYDPPANPSSRCAPRASTSARSWCGRSPRAPTGARSWCRAPASGRCRSASR